MERPYTSRLHLWSEQPSLIEMANVFYRICPTIINGECGLMKLPRKARIFNVPCEGWFRNLTQRLVHGIVAQAFARRVFVPTSVVVLLFIGKGFVRRSSGSPSITSTIRLFRGRFGAGRWTSLPSMTQLPLQLIDFTLYVSVILCILPLRPPFRSRLLRGLLYWEPLDSAWCRLTFTWCGPASSIVNVATESPSD